MNSRWHECPKPCYARATDVAHQDAREKLACVISMPRPAAGRLFSLCPPRKCSNPPAAKAPGASSTSPGGSFSKSAKAPGASGSFSKSAKAVKHIQRAVVDDIRDLHKSNLTLKKDSARKQRLARWMALSAAAGVLVMMVGVEGRLQREQHGDRTPDEALALSISGINTCKSLGMAITVVCLALLALYYKTHLAVLRKTSTPLTRLQIIVPLLEAICLLVGVIPPYVDATFRVALVDADVTRAEYPLVELDSCALNAEDFCVRCHIDVLGVLMLGRVVLVLKWLVIGVFMTEIDAPAMLEWVHNVHVTPFFRVKYLFVKHPIWIICTIWACDWVFGAYAMHAFEHSFAPGFGYMLSDTYDVITNLGGNVHRQNTVPGRMVGMLMTVIGLVAMALLTATFCANAELDPTEAELIKKLESQRARVQRKLLATEFLRQHVRIWRDHGKEGIRAARHRWHVPDRLHLSRPDSRGSQAHRALKPGAYLSAVRRFKKANLDYRTQVVNVRTINATVHRMLIEQEAVRKLLTAQTSLLAQQHTEQQATRARLIEQGALLENLQGVGDSLEAIAVAVQQVVGPSARIDQRPLAADAPPGGRPRASTYAEPRASRFSLGRPTHTDSGGLEAVRRSLIQLHNAAAEDPAHRRRMESAAQGKLPCNAPPLAALAGAPSAARPASRLSKFEDPACKHLVA